MSDSSRSGSPSTRAFTYVEALVMIAVTLLLAGLATINIVGIRRNQNIRGFKRDLTSLAQDARSYAIEHGAKVSLTYEESTQEVRESAELSDGSTIRLRSLPLAEGLTVVHFAADRYELNGLKWRVPYYQDGLSAGGAMEFAQGQEHFSFVQPNSDAPARIQAGVMPDLAKERWPAGGYEKRS